MKPKIAKLGSYKIQVESGRKYYICGCGYSSNQPFCDGSHKEYNNFVPIEYIAEETKIVGFCGCKYSNKMPLCDGQHKFLQGEV